MSLRSRLPTRVFVVLPWTFDHSLIMKSIITPNCNEQLIRTALENSHGLRIDGRRKDDYRPLEVVFGRRFGSVLVSLGNTRVLATVTATIVEPKMSRPQEGQLKITIDLSPMASPHYDSNRQTERQKDEMVEISRLLERSVRDARCVDMESLCLAHGKKAWLLEVNLIVYNTEGNLIEPCSFALMAALSHFKRPDVTVTEEGDIVVHDFDDKQPIPLTVFHLPFCLKFCFFERKNTPSVSHIIIVDPLEEEEDVSDGYIIVGANAHRELTAVHIAGKARIDSDVVQKCCHRSIERSKRLTTILKKALMEDKERRESDPSLKEIGFAAHLRSFGPALLGSHNVMEQVDVEEVEEEKSGVEEVVENTKAFRFMGQNVADEGEDVEMEMDESRKIGKWDFGEDEEDEDCGLIDPSSQLPSTSKGGKKQLSKQPIPVDSSDEEEGDVMILDSTEFKK